MAEELRDVYVDKSLEQAYNNGDAIFINEKEDRIREFLASTRYMRDY